MVLTEAQAKLFYDLWIPLLDFVNRKYKLCKEFYGMDSPKDAAYARVGSNGQRKRSFARTHEAYATVFAVA